MCALFGRGTASDARQWWRHSVHISPTRCTGRSRRGAVPLGQPPGALGRHRDPAGGHRVECGVCPRHDVLCRRIGTPYLPAELLQCHPGEDRRGDPAPRQCAAPRARGSSHVGAAAWIAPVLLVHGRYLLLYRRGASPSRLSLGVLPHHVAACPNGGTLGCRDEGGSRVPIERARGGTPQPACCLRRHQRHDHLFHMVGA